MRTTIALFATIVLMNLAGCKGGKEIATVNGRSVSKTEFDAYMKFKRFPANDPKKADSLLDQYLEREALADAITKEKLLDPVMVQAELNEFRKNLFINRYFQKYLEQAANEQAIADFYRKHVQEFEERKVKVAHVLVRANKKMDVTEKQAKLTKAREAYSMIQKGEDFGKVVERYSEDKTSTSKGGDLGWLKEGSVDPDFSEKVFGMKAGEISEPFETAFGFHVVKILEEPKKVKKPLQAVQGMIRYRLRSEAKEKEMQRLIKKVNIEKVKTSENQ